MTMLPREFANYRPHDPNALLRQELAEAQRDLEKLRHDAEFHLEITGRLHRSLLPSPVNHPRIDVAVRHVPVEVISGEYCQVRFPFPTTCYITMCHIGGRGLGPCLLATRVSSEVRHFILSGLRPAEMVESVNAFVLDHFPDFHDTAWVMSFLAVRIELESQIVSYSCAGHPGPLFLRGSRWQELQNQNPAIGLRRHVLVATPEHSRCFARGDRLLFYTPGMTEAVNRKGQQFDKSRLAAIACEAHHVAAFRLADHIIEQRSQFQHAHDATLIVAELK